MTEEDAGMHLRELLDNRDPLQAFHEQEKEQIWAMRLDVSTNYRESLPKLLSCVRWNCHSDVAQVGFAWMSLIFGKYPSALCNASLLTLTLWTLAILGNMSASCQKSADNLQKVGHFKTFINISESAHNLYISFSGFVFLPFC